MNWTEEILRSVHEVTSHFGRQGDGLREPLITAVRALILRFHQSLLELELEERPWGYDRASLGLTDDGCEVIVVRTRGDSMEPHNHVGLEEGQERAIDWGLVFPFDGAVMNETFNRQGQGAHVLLRGPRTRIDFATPLFIPEQRRAPIHRLVADPHGSVARSLHVYGGNTDRSVFFRPSEGWVIAS